jgi:hypothetical protein
MGELEPNLEIWLQSNSITALLNTSRYAGTLALGLQLQPRINNSYGSRLAVTVLTRDTPPPSAVNCRNLPGRIVSYPYIFGPYGLYNKSRVNNYNLSSAIESTAESSV